MKIDKKLSDKAPW